MSTPRLTSWLPLKSKKKVRRFRESPVVLERLEDRTAPAIFTVTWDGTGAQPGGTTSLQQAITAANANPGSDQINFNLAAGLSVFVNSAGGGPGLLPDITDTVTIEGFNQGTTNKITVVLQSASAADAISGFHVTGAAKNTIIRNLNILDPSNNGKFFNAIPLEFGIKVTAAGGGFNLQNVDISNIDGTAVWIIDSPNNIIGGAGSKQALTLGIPGATGGAGGNNGHGVHITGALSTNNLVQQATIQLNAGDGVRIDGGAFANIVGGFTNSPVNSGNIIMQNNGSGVRLNDSDDNRVQRNFIGTNPAGDVAKANSGHGIIVENGSGNNIIGGNDLSAGNVIAGNTENGIYIKGLLSTFNQIQSNVIGLDPTDTAVALPNSGSGILVEGAPNTKVGSTTTAANFVSGNNLHGIAVVGADSAGTVVVNNRIGVTRSGGYTGLTGDLDTKRGNVQDGVFLSNTTNVTVGGGGTNAQNIIGANRHGIAIVDSTSIIARGNQLGINKISNNTYPSLGNLQDGISVLGTGPGLTDNITLGGTQSLEGNKFAGNRNGIRVVNASNVTMQGNFIGTNLTGLPPGVLPDPFQPVPNAEDGIFVENSSIVRIGTPAQNGGNLISRNRHGISITKGSTDIRIQNNRIGTQNNANLTPDLGNFDDAVFVDASSNVTIGGSGPSEPNVLAKNLDGIQISGGTTNVVIQGNLIRNNSQSGVRIENSSQVTIGGTTTSAKNTIANTKSYVGALFQLDGIFIVSGSSDNVIQGNWIGTDSTLAAGFGNKGNGILVDGSSNNKIGAFRDALNYNPATQGNIIAFNSFNGVAVVESTGPANGNSILGNAIYNSGRLAIDLGNTSGDVTFNDLGDPDTGANDLQNFPVLSNADSGAGGLIVQGVLNSKANRDYRIEFFHVPIANQTGNPTGYGQAQNYVGSKIVTTDANGDAAITFTDATQFPPVGEYITATATDMLTGDTSEVSLVQIISGAQPATYVVNNDGNYAVLVELNPPPGLIIPANGNMTLANAIRLANEHPGPDRIVFALHPQYTITTNGALTYYQESRFLFTNGDLPDVTDEVLIDGSPLAYPQVKGGDKRFTQNYTIVFNKASHGLKISDNASPAAKASNPNAKAQLVVVRHINVSGSAGVGVEIATKWGGANLQDMSISGFAGDGIRIFKSPNNIVGGSGANQAVNIDAVGGTGVNIIGAESTGNLVQQTNIGTKFGAGGNGIWIQSANNNTIGGFVTGTNVKIQASNINGIYLINSSGTRVQRATVGDPTNVFPNRVNGILVEDSPNTLIGGVDKQAGNTIVGNTEHGIYVLGTLSAGVQIQSNQIGTTSAPNSGHGILVDGVQNVLIGSTVTAANAIDGNNRSGVYIRPRTIGAVTLNSNGARIVNTSVGAGGGNVEDGIVVDTTADVIIGGAGSNSGGKVSENKRGISLINASKIVVQQMTVTGNSEEGLRIANSDGVLIGGTTAKSGNSITSNRDGIRALNSSVLTIQGNQILNQSEDGVIIDGTGNVVVGSPAQFGGNTISTNRNGVRVINNSSNFRVENNILNNNGDDAIRLDGITGAVVGGTLPLSANIATGNRNGLHLTNKTSGTVVLGNTFSKSVENGISLQGSSNNTIGGKTAAERNVIFSNTRDGVFIGPDFTNPLLPVFSNNNTVQGNYIGVDSSGTGNFGNQNAGVYIDGGNNNLIGGTLHDVANKFEHGNVIANSSKNGVAVVIDNGPAAGNRIIGNNIFGNALLGIDLNSNLGLVDFNDPQDTDTGANGLQNFPIIEFAEAGLVSSLVTGKFNSTPNRTFRLEFFADSQANPGGTPVGYGQGRQYLGFTQVTTDGNGDAIFSFFAPVSLGASGVVSATATDETTNDTSEFAESKQVQIAVGKIEGIKFEDKNGNGIFDPGEPGLPGWVINLEVADSAGNFDGKVDASTTTDATGRYEFKTLTDGKYKLSEVLQPGWVQTAAPVPNPMQITGGATISNADFGNFKTVKVFGVKFEDKNGNMIRDPGEGPIAGVTINLLDAKTNTLFATTATDLSGNYAFTNLFIGKFGKNDTGFYRVREVVPAGFVQTTPNPADFQIVSGKDVGPLDFGNKKTVGGGPGGGTGILVAGVDAGRAPQVKVFSAQSGTVLFNFLAYAPNFTGGVRVAKGDVNGDGAPDIITGPGLGGGPHVKIFDGNTGVESQAYMAFATNMTRGIYVGSGDVNGDGFADVIVGTGAGVAPRVKVFDGQTQIELFDFAPFNPLFRGGVTVAGGDVNGDGFADIIVGAGAGGGPHVRVFDGSQFGKGPNIVPTELWGFMAFDPRVRTGVFVNTANITPDKRADIITGLGPGLGGVPQVKVFDGGSKTELYNFFAFADQSTPIPKSMFLSDPRYVTGIRIAAFDFNGDGIDDIAAAPGRAKGPRIQVYDGQVAGTRAKLFDVLAFDPLFLGGVFVG